MFNFYSRLSAALESFWLTYRRTYGRAVYVLLSLSVITGIWVVTPTPTQAISWADIIFRGIQVIQLSNLSDSQEVALGQQINKQLAGEEVKIYKDRAATKYVDQIGQRLAKQSDRPNIPYTFQIVDDKDINAFATMGGFVYVNKGLMAAADNEAQLASVLAHEIGHIAAKHSVKQMRQMAIAQGVASAAGLDRNQAVQIGVELALRRPHSREAEYQADQLGLRTLGRAGYAQSAMIDFMKKLLNQSSVPTFLSTHPATSDRIAAMRQYIDPASADRGEGLNNGAYKQKISQFLGY
ncbi:MAG TPA: M48 family metallopeptidase [Kamptonema sp.]|nr:M48 family metallopeptidase [Kamptonema sp.]